MKRLILILTLILLSTMTARSQFQQNSSRSLFSDVKAYRVNDAVMVYIIEETRADNSASTGSGRESDLGAGFNFNAGESGASGSGGINTNNNFEGEGATSRQEAIRAKLSAKVVEVVENGNLKIEGTRTTKINGETQTVIISGIVRPVDISPGNAVYSYNIMDMTLTIEGEGIISESQEPGLLTKFLRMLF